MTMLGCGSGEAGLGATERGRVGNRLDPGQRNPGSLGGHFWGLHSMGGNREPAMVPRLLLSPNPQQVARPQVRLKQGLPGGKRGLCRVVRGLVYTCGRALGTVGV